MLTAQLEYSWDEILADPPIVEPLRAGALACHGGFLADGTYASPRTLHRVPAIRAWQDHHRAQFGTEILDSPMDAWPGNYPNLAQGKFLLEVGAEDPIIALLTRVGTVEGFGARIRYLAPVRVQRYFVEDVTGTAIAHLEKGLVEAHARDEAGWDDQAGHDQMWFAVRDLAFDYPVSADQTEEMMRRMGISKPAGAQPQPTLLFPDLELEPLVTIMCRVLFIEIKAFHIFAWAESLLWDDAARLVSYIRADETPHVEYLRTALTEMRDRTFIGTSGRLYPGTEVVGRIWDKALAASMGPAEEQSRQAMTAEVERVLSPARMEQFVALGC